MNTAPTTAVRVSRRSITEGMTVSLPDADRGRQFVAATVEQQGEATRIVSARTGIAYTITNDDAAYVIPADGEVWG
jgi:hypothetical protein